MQTLGAPGTGGRIGSSCPSSGGHRLSTRNRARPEDSQHSVGELFSPQPPPLPPSFFFSSGGVREMVRATMGTET